MPKYELLTNKHRVDGAPQAKGTIIELTEEQAAMQGHSRVRLVNESAPPALKVVVKAAATPAPVKPAVSRVVPTKTPVPAAPAAKVSA